MSDYLVSLTSVLNDINYVSLQHTPVLPLLLNVFVGSATMLICSSFFNLGWLFCRISFSTMTLSSVTGHQISNGATSTGIHSFHFISIAFRGPQAKVDKIYMFITKPWFQLCSTYWCSTNKDLRNWETAITGLEIVVLVPKRIAQSSTTLHASLKFSKHCISLKLMDEQTKLGIQPFFSWRLFVQNLKELQKWETTILHWPT